MEAIFQKLQNYKQELRDSFLPVTPSLNLCHHFKIIVNVSPHKA